MIKLLAIGGVLILSTTSAYAQVSNAMTLSDSIAQKNKDVVSSGSYISKADFSKEMKTPVGLSAPNSSYSIIIDDVSIAKNGGTFEASAMITLPGSDQPIFFRARKVPFTSKGGLRGVARLELVTADTIPMPGGVKLMIPQDGKTYVEFDCNGFRQLSLSADLLFDSNLLVSANPKEPWVKSHIQTVIKDANDFLISVSLPPFKLKGLNDYVFTVSDATWDQSDYSNPEGFSFPRTYSDPLYSVQPSLWRGVFFRKLSVTLPAYLNGGKSKPIEVAGENMVYDDSGFSGVFSASNILQLAKGTIATGFNLSVNRLALELSQNQLAKGELEGYLQLPVSKKDTIMYQATADATGKLLFVAGAKSKLSFDVWRATVNVGKGSSLSIEAQGDDVTIRALFNGTMDIKAPVSEGSSKTLGLSVPFEELLITNKPPYMEVKAFGLTNINASQSIAGVDFTLNSLKFRVDSGWASIAADIDLAIGGSGSNSFGAGGKIAVNGLLREGRWEYSGISIDKFKLATEFSGFSLNGTLSLFNNSPQYGDGVSGNITMELKTLKMKLGASAIFGKVNGYKYWYTDAFTSVNIPIASGVNLVSLGGGAFSKMRQGMPQNVSEDYGRGSSGVSYIPDEKMPFGFMAKVGLTTTDGLMLQGDVALEMAFNRYGGISYISFLGYARLMSLGKMAESASVLKEKAGKLAAQIEKVNSKIGKVAGSVGIKTPGKPADASGLKDRAEAIAEGLKKDSKDAPISATLYSIFDFDNGSFFSKLEATVNVAGVLKGVNPGNKAGEMVIYFGPDKWYIQCGTPKTPIGLELLGLAKATAYFMMGHDLPPFPEPPQKVLDIIGLEKKDNSRDISSLAGGRGIAFGASLDVNTGNIQFLIFYARLAAGLGFDVMLKNYGTSQCAGSDSPLGINGWYAMGQAWAYVEGEIGIRVKMMFIKGTFPILKIGVGTLLEAQLPNPTWLHGAVGGYYNILGGLVKGKCKFEFELGEKCKIKSNPKDLLANMQVISEIRPSDGSSNINVFSKPQAVLNMPVNKSFEIDAPDGEKYKFRAKLDRFVALNGGSPIVGEMLLNEDSTVVTIRPHSILPEKRNLTISCELSFEEYKRGAWTKVMDNGRPVTEAKAVTFLTGDAPDFIPEDNVTIEYPVRGQRAFYREEHDKGFVVLDAWQDNLFNNPKFAAFALFKKGEQVIGRSTITTDYDKKRINFTIPQSSLAVSSEYSLVLVNEPVDKNTNIDKNVVKKEVEVTNEGDVGELTLTKGEAKEDLVIAEDKELYKLSFSTSRYSKFRDKITNMSTTLVGRKISQMSMVPLLLNTSSEHFDGIEKDGSRTSAGKPLVQFYSDLSDNSWFKEKIEPFVYVDYPFLSVGKVDRDVNDYGLYPYKAIEFEAGTDNIFYNIPYVAKTDYGQVRDKVSRYFINKGSISEAQKSRVQTLITTYPKDFYSVYGESRTILIRYVLPDGSITSEEPVIFYYKKYE